jgi:hypothetical protein
MGVYCLSNLTHDFEKHFYNWIESENNVRVNFGNSIDQCLDSLFSEPIERTIEKRAVTPAGMLSFLL